MSKQADTRIERSIHRDLTQVMRWLVAVAVRCGVHDYANVTGRE